MAMRACRDCGAEISTRASACPRCGRPTMGLGRKLFNAFGLLWLVALAVGFWMFTSAAIRLADRMDDPSHISAGDTARLDGDGVVTLAVDRGDAPEMDGSDPEAMVALIRAGRVLATPQGTRAEVVAVEGGRVRVRLLDGPALARSGWLDRSHVRKEVRPH